MGGARVSMFAAALGLGAWAPPAAADTAYATIPTAAAPATPNAEPNRHAWSFGLTGMRQELKSGKADELIGNNAAVQVGMAYISDSWYTDVSLDILLGPYEPVRERQVDADFTGTGVTVWAGASAQSMNLRSAQGGYGFALGLTYADLAGKSTGPNRLDNGTSTGSAGSSPAPCPPGSPASSTNSCLIDDYSMRATYLSLLPAIFFSWLEPARPRGNTPELLMTRVEGYFLTIGAAMPVVANYSSQYLKRGDTNQYSEHGKLSGYSLLVTLKAMLGS